LEQRRIDGIADQEVTGQSNIDTDALASEIATKREHAEALIERARLAAAKIIRIRTQRAALREQQAALQERFRPAQHAARMQALGMAMPALIAAERQYVQALTKAFAAAAAADELARAPGPQLGFAGLLPIADLLLPRPVHPTYKDIPSPQRPDISAAVTSEAERLVKELS
jgi:hypothetical protein